MGDFNLNDLRKAVEDTTDNGITCEGQQNKWGKVNEVKDLITKIDNCPSLIYLNLEGNSLGVEAAKAISDALKKHPEFKKALWKDLFTGRLKEEIPKALEYLGQGIIFANANLTVLDLSDNALGPNGMSGLLKFLSSSSCYSLQELKLNNCGLGITGGKMLVQALLDCLKNSENAGRTLGLKVFIAGRNRLENVGAKALGNLFAKLNTLEEVSMPQNGISSKGIEDIFNGLKLNKNMRLINLNDNTIGSNGAEYIAEALSSMQKLREINFGDCLIKTRGALTLSEALQDTHTDLEYINLEGNEIRADGGLAIIDALQNKPNLKKVSIDTNMFGQEACEIIKEIMSKHHNPDVLGSLSEDELCDDTDEDEEEVNDDDENSNQDEYVYDSEEEFDAENYITAVTEESLNTTEDKSLNASDYACFVSTEILPNNIESFCKAPNPSLKTFELLEEKDKLQAFRNYLNKFSDDSYLLGLSFTILKCSSLSEESPEALEIAEELYKDLFDFAIKTYQITRVKNFFLIQLGLLKCEDKSFQPCYSSKSCWFALRSALSKNIFPDDAKNTFQLFLDRMTTKN